MSFKSDFPLFSKHPHLTYLDSASTSQKPSYVIDHIADYLSYHNSNIHRGIYDLAIDSEEFYQSSKKKAGKLIHTSAKHIIYSYNATMCFNLLAQSLWQSQVLQSGDHVIVSIAEHHANIVPWQMLAKQDIIIDRVRLTDSGMIDMDHLESLLTARTRLISLTACSNIFGINYDLSAIREMIGERYLCIDASQVIPHHPYDMQAVGADAVIYTGHKMMALTGIGVLGCSDRLLDRIEPVWGGGDMITDVTQEGYTVQGGIGGFEPGTPHIVGALSLGYAYDYIQHIGGYEVIQKYESDYVHKISQIFAKHQDHIHLVGGNQHAHHRHVRSFVVDRWTPIRVAERCADHQICIRFGGHCAHPLIRHLGHEQGGLCRISTYLYNDDNDLQVIADMFEMMRKG